MPYMGDGHVMSMVYPMQGCALCRGGALRRGLSLHRGWSHHIEGMPSAEFTIKVVSYTGVGYAPEGTTSVEGTSSSRLCSSSGSSHSCHLTRQGLLDGERANLFLGDVRQSYSREICCRNIQGKYSFRILCKDRSTPRCML